MRTPEFMVIGAMKCGTSALHEQLHAQPGVFMCTPKEPNFFSDDEIYARGTGWYSSLFDDAPAGAICGESSTHSTKLPDLPHAVERIAEHCPDAKFVYVMRHPVDRLVSHYVHDWSERVVTVGIDDAVASHSALINYGRYAMQIGPYLGAFGADRVLPVFFESMMSRPQHELERIARFVGIDGPVAWQADGGQNVSSHRLRKGKLLDFIMDAPVVSSVRKNIVPPAAREWVKNRFFRMTERPELSEDVRASVETRFDEDLANLGGMLGLEGTLSCATFKERAHELENPGFVSRQAARA